MHASSSGVRTATRLHPEQGATLIELVLVMTLLVLVAAMAVPSTAQAIDAGRARLAAGFVASRLRLARQDAIFKSRQIGAVFDWVGNRWLFSICADGNRNGIRRAEILAGVDACIEGPHDLQQRFQHIQIAVNPLLAGPEGSLASPDPVRFGPSDIASFSPAGSCTPGTLFIRSREGTQYAVRVGGATGRTRILRFETGTQKWIDG